MSKSETTWVVCMLKHIFFSYGFKEIMKVSQRVLVFFAGFVMQRLFTRYQFVMQFFDASS